METKPTRTLTALRLRLQGINKARIAGLAGVSVKTIQRIQNGQVNDISVASADWINDALDFIARDMQANVPPRLRGASSKKGM